jgi:hypothetical protein
MHLYHDYSAKLIAEAKMRDSQLSASHHRLVRELRIRYRRQLILWLCYVARRVGQSLVSWSDRIEDKRIEAKSRKPLGRELAPITGG